MCYSALVKMNVKQLGLTYRARVQLDLWEDLFVARLGGSGAKIPRALEAAFLGEATTFAEKRIQKAIRDFTGLAIEAARVDLEAQTKRLVAAEKTLLTKVTKKARNDQRVARDKIDRLSQKIRALEDPDAGSGDDDARIYPGQYAPLLSQRGEERAIRPFRYLLRPRGQTADFDRKFNGSYNARRDRLREVFWWKSVYGKNHGALVIRAFYENVKLHDFENRPLRPGEEEKNLILKFEPDALDEMVVPCIWDRNDADAFTLDSFALITDEPNPEVAAVGHDRTPIILRSENIDLWLATGGDDLSVYERALEEKQPTFFEHAVAA